MLPSRGCVNAAGFCSILERGVLVLPDVIDTAAAGRGGCTAEGVVGGVIGMTCEVGSGLGATAGAGSGAVGCVDTVDIGAGCGSGVIGAGSGSISTGEVGISDSEVIVWAVVAAGDVAGAADVAAASCSRCIFCACCVSIRGSSTKNVLPFL